MKLNVKGLVFVGFAAAVFASAAQADSDKIVTSKTYVDNKITQTIGTSTTTAPSENAVKGALALKADDNVVVKGIKENGANENLTMTNGIVELPAAQTVGTGVLTIQKNGTAVDTFNANATENKTINVTVPTTVAELTDASNYQTTANLVTSMTAQSTDTQYPSAKAVYDQLATKADATDIPTTVAELTDAGDYQLKANISNDLTTDAASTTKYPSVKAIKDYADALPGATAYTGGGDTTVSGHTITTTIPVKGVQVNGTDLTPDSTTKKVNVVVPTTVASLSDASDYQTVANMSANMTTDTGSTSKYPTVAAVESYVTGLNNNLNLPANNSGAAACSTTKPCALVWTGTGQPTWEQIEQ